MTITASMPMPLRIQGGMIKLPSPAKGAAKPAVESVNLNLGIYGVPAAVKRSPAGLFPMATRVRRLEAWLRDHGGF
eukprot:SAG22_NODE_11767_length_470_cov_0.835580_1_plen_75_part_10